jgi:hypothetical protein
MKHTAILAAALLTAAAGAQAACYTVFDAKGNIISESPNPPVNMAYQLHQTVPYKYGTGARLVYGLTDLDCGERVDTWDELDDIAPVSYNRKPRNRRARRDRN